MNNQKPVRGIQLNRTHPLAKGLVGCWLFNEFTGETVFDLSGNGNNGTLKNGVAWGNDGLDFDGVDDYVDCGNSTSLNLGNTMTLEAWIYPTIIGVDQGIISLHNGIANTAVFKILNNNKLNIMYPGLDIANTTYTFPSECVWYHVVYTRSGVGSGTHAFYVNGELKSLARDGAENFLDTSDNTIIGSRKTTLQWFNGSIRSINIYNQAKSAEEVAWLHREPYAIFDKRLSPALLYAAAAAGVPNAAAMMMMMLM